MARKHIFLIHGRYFKPGREVVFNNWLAAIEHGLKRDFRSSIYKKIHDVKISNIYFGDLSNDTLKEYGLKYDLNQDVEDRKKALEELMGYKKSDFEKKNAKKIYKKLPKKDSTKEFYADMFGGVLATIRFSEPIIFHVAPDMKKYWECTDNLGSEVRWRLAKKLAKAVKDGDDILLVSHSLGTMISYDVLWEFTHNEQYSKLREAGNKISLWLTLGSPLGDETVKKNLKGATATEAKKYPDNINKWVNVAAEDDYISHDQEIKNDYKKMRELSLLEEPIEDKLIYNFAIRGDASNPHHSTGYLIHPIVCSQIATWLNKKS